MNTAPQDTMNITRTPTHEELNLIATRHNVEAVLRHPDEPTHAYLNRVQQQFPIDLPTYQQEALLDFAESHGTYPPILILAARPELTETWHETLEKHRGEHGTRTITKQLAEHHQFIQARLAAGVSVPDIATELNCSSKNLRAYLRTLEEGN